MRPAQEGEQGHFAEGGNAAAKGGRALGEAVGDGIEKLQLLLLRDVVEVWGVGYDGCAVVGSDAEAGR